MHLDATPDNSNNHSCAFCGAKPGMPCVYSTNPPIVRAEMHAGREGAGRVAGLEERVRVAEERADRAEAALRESDAALAAVRAEVERLRTWIRKGPELRRTWAAEERAEKAEAMVQWMVAFAEEAAEQGYNGGQMRYYLGQKLEEYRRG